MHLHVYTYMYTAQEIYSFSFHISTVNGRQYIRSTKIINNYYSQ